MQDKNENIKSPILNNPYDEPRLHYGSVDGNLDYNTILKGRRPFSMEIGITPNNNAQQSFFNDEDYYNDDANASFINTIREEVKKWREQDYPANCSISGSAIQNAMTNRNFSSANVKPLRLPYISMRWLSETLIWADTYCISWKSDKVPLVAISTMSFHVQPSKWQQVRARRSLWRCSFFTTT